MTNVKDKQIILKVARKKTPTCYVQDTPHKVIN